jgi:hypothetical protein
VESNPGWAGRGGDQANGQVEAVQQEDRVQLGFVPLSTTVEVKDVGMLVDPHRVGTVNQIGSAAIADRVTTLPAVPCRTS